MEKIKYIAYGSNMNLEQMAYRCPTAKVIGNAKLNGYELLFRGGNGGAVATVEKKKGSFVLVLVWELEPSDEAALDRYEGWPHFYRKEWVKVRLGNKWLKTMVYIMNEGRPLGAPSKYYYNTILQGYLSAGFNPDYLKAALNKHEGRKTDKVVEQILKIRESGLTNMLDTLMVQRIAYQNDYFELVLFIEENKREYVEFILTGEWK